MSPAGGCSRTTPPSKYPMGVVSRRPAAELLSLLPSLSAPSGVRLAGYLQLTDGWCRRSRSGGKMGGRAADGVRHPGGSPPGPGGAAGPPLRAVTRLLQPAQVDDGLASSSAHAADQRPALIGPRARRWARGVAPATFRRHSHLRRSARGRRESVELRSVSRPRRDARCTRARCARFAQLERVGGLGRDKRLTSWCSVERAAVRWGGGLALALGEPYVRGCRGSGDLKSVAVADPRL